ncbi:hypothetical protein PIGHUM_02072 [Pigmentiphaga humi]|uniref:DUF445 domain-containing protein n=1 Tax=Pigmentiphaga humi TaxID=2478468 RepID=A0A3P4B4C4_9BURK|nr:DUF445 domain-containing protein [Pigmentiphaga humi]VCU70005.1 hypothetical protein PIGHUM_02072 [Pigmentiphaga humi]
MKLGALGLLAASLAGFALSHAMGGQGAWGWLRAFCEAATVGALADWFAVVALFRHPLGLPIPHTAIIPSNKQRLADNLAVFVRDHFLDPEALLAKLKVFDPAARLGAWLSEPAQAKAAAAMARAWARQALDLLDEQAVRDAIQRFVVARLRSWDAAATAVDVLGLLTRDGRHQQLLDEALRRLGDYLSHEGVKARVSDLMVKYARKEWPRIVGTVNLVKPVDSIADNLADRLARALLEELQEVLSQPDHPLRQDYEAWLRAYVDRLRDDPALREQVDALKSRLIDHPTMQAYVQGLWSEIHGALRRNLDGEDTPLARHLEQGLLAMGRQVAANPALRDAINEHVMTGAQSLAQRLRHGVTEHIATTVKGWDERHLVQELELSVGRDLQYIRYNGTLVGGLIGIALHALVLLMA